MPNIIKRNTVTVKNNGVETKCLDYPMNDLDSVYTHYDPATGKNVATPNELPKKEVNDIDN